jgi:two-component system cell cycle response regulator
MSGTVLIADDSAVVRAVIRRQLEADGHTVLEAGDGQEALRVCADSTPDVILLDVEMPILDGHGTLARLKADPATQNIPVVFLTGRVETADVVAGLQLGAHDYLRKPFEANELAARVGAALRASALQQELQQRMQQLEEASRTDMLTGVDNRRQIDEHLRVATSAARRYGRTIGILMIDVDHFKTINDDHGHAAGDAVLQELARRLRGGLRGEDAVGRWGGEEFIVILRETLAEGSTVVAERLRGAISATPFELEDGTRIPVTVSIGHVTGRDDGQELLRRADQAMYVAKAGGRDRVVEAAALDVEI